MPAPIYRDDNITGLLPISSAVQLHTLAWKEAAKHKQEDRWHKDFMNEIKTLLRNASKGILRHHVLIVAYFDVLE